MPFLDVKAADKWRKDRVLLKKDYDQQRNQMTSVKKNRCVSRKKRRGELRRWFLQLKANRCCARCDEKHPYCLDFHHKDASAKLFGLSDGISRQMTQKRILVEISKCELLCANCHRKHHWPWPPVL